MTDATGDTHPQSYYAPDKYALSGKIMLSAIIILFTVILLVVCLHIYARWYLARYRRNLRTTRRRTPHIIFISDVTTATVSHGLQPSVLNSLPTFVYSPNNTHTHTQECAVCLCEFEGNDKGRLLPKCNHSFHIECIDMWFASHSTCPLCRAPVVGSEIPTPRIQDNQIQIVVESPNQITSTSTSSGRLGRNLSIEVPRRNESFKNLEDESPLRRFKSPGGRILSLKRILSREGRPSTPMSCGSPNVETDLERGGEASTPLS